MADGQKTAGGSGSGSEGLIRTRTARTVREQAIKGLLVAAAVLSVLTTTGIVVLSLIHISEPTRPY